MPQTPVATTAIRVALRLLRPLLALCAVSACGVATAESVHGEEFARDPGSAWQFGAHAASHAVGVWTGDEGHGGKGCLHARNPSWYWASWVCGTTFPATPGERYRITCWIKSKPGSGGVRYHVTAVNNVHGPPNPGPEWQCNEWIYTVREDEDKLSLGLLAHGAGSSVWFDDLHVERLTRAGVWARVEWPSPRNHAPGTVPEARLYLENPVDHERTLGLDMTVHDLEGTEVVRRTGTVRLRPNGEASETIRLTEVEGASGWFESRLNLTEADETLSTFWQEFTIFDEQLGLPREVDPTSAVAANLMPHNSFRDNYTEAGNAHHVERVTHELGRLKALGVDCLRLWTQLRTGDDGQYLPRGDLDLMCPIAAAHGVQMTMVLGADADAGGTCGADFARQDRDEYVRWVEWAAGRYGKWVRTFEIANEVKATPEYLDALRAAYLAVKRVDPGLRVLHAAGYWYHWQNPKTADVYAYGRRFWPHLLAFAWPYSDGLNIHEYGVPQTYLPGFLRRYRTVCDEHATGTYAESIWQTECGSESGVSRPHGVTYPPGLSPRDHAAAAAHQYLMTKAAAGPDVDHKAFWYLPTDGWGRPVAGWWATGFYDVTRSPKAAAPAAKATAAQLRDATFVGELSTSGRDHLMVFRRGAHFLVAAWASSKTYRTTPEAELGAVGVTATESQGRVQVMLPATANVRLCDLSLRERTVQCPDGQLALSLDQLPVFVHGVAPGILLAAARRSVSDTAAEVENLFRANGLGDLIERLRACREQAVSELEKGTEAEPGRLARVRAVSAELGGEVVERARNGGQRRGALASLNVWRIGDLLREVEAFLEHRARAERPKPDVSPAEAELARCRARLSVDRHAPKTAALLRLVGRRLYQVRRALAAGDMTEAHLRHEQAIETLRRSQSVFDAEPHYGLSTWIRPTKYLWTGDDLALDFTVHNESSRAVACALRVREDPAGWDISMPLELAVPARATESFEVRAVAVTGSRRTTDLVIEGRLGRNLFTTPIGVGLQAAADGTRQPQPPTQPVTWRIPWWTGPDGNPYVDPTGARWEACQLTRGADPAVLSSYAPMPWDATTGRWFGPDTKHGHPSFSGNRPVLSCSYLDDGHRDPALIFTAPQDGLYTLSGSIHVSEYPKSGTMREPLTLEIGAWGPSGSAFRQLFCARITERGELDLVDPALACIPLVKGQRLLVCRFRIGNLYRYASYTLDKLRLSFTPGSATRARDDATARLPAPGEFVTIRDGHLSFGGERLRIWSAQGNLLAADYACIDAEVRRLAAMGFNGYRTPWWSLSPDSMDYTKGDLSPADRRDYLLASLATHGVRVWCDALNSATVNASHADVVEDPPTRADWLAAVGDTSHRRPIWVVWDKRGEKAYIQEIKALLNHVNQHTGLRWADDPAFFCWEITNEQWWIQRILKYGNHLKLPAFFRHELLRQWNAWLTAKYGDDTRLREAWLGSLLPGESMATTSVVLLPLLKTVTLDQAEVLGLDIGRATDRVYGPRDFSRRRGSDLMQFLVEMLLAHKRRVYAAMRAVGRPGVGVSVVPIVFDTGFSFSPQSTYVNSFGDAVAVGCYMSQISVDPQHPRFPFRSNLEEPPRLFYDNPWLEHNKVEGKPTFVYETQIFKPAKYRAEYPYMLAMLASIQDWDVIDWHYYGHPTKDILTDPRPFARMLRPDNSFSWQGTQFKHDEVQVAAMKVASELFRQFALVPPERPTRLTLGGKALFDTDMHEWGHLNSLLAPTSYRYGLRLRFDPAADTAVTVDGPVVHGRQYLSPVIQPTRQVRLDWHKGVLRLDAPTAKVACGFLPDQIVFADDVELSGLSVSAPEGMPYFAANEDRYVCFGMVARDGRALSETRAMLLSAVCTSFNTGFSINTDAFPGGNQYGRLVDHVPTGKIARDFGSTPVLVARVGLTLKAPCLANTTFRLLDWHLDVLREGRIGADGVLTIRNDEPAFCTEITREQD